MSAIDSAEVLALGAADEAGAALATVKLLHREFVAVQKMDKVLRDMVEAEEALGLDVAAGQFEEMMWLLQSALGRIVRELGRVPA